jgi:hypothetical protein
MDFPLNYCRCTAPARLLQQMRKIKSGVFPIVHDNNTCGTRAAAYCCVTSLRLTCPSPPFTPSMRRSTFSPRIDKKESCILVADSGYFIFLLSGGNGTPEIYIIHESL